MAHLAPAWPEQKLCKENKRRAIEEQQKRWMAQRAEAIGGGGGSVIGDQRRHGDEEDSDDLEDDLDEINSFLDGVGDSLDSPPPIKREGMQAAVNRSIGEISEPINSDDDEDMPPELRGSEHGRMLRTSSRPGAAACRVWHDALGSGMQSSSAASWFEELQSDCARLVSEGSRTFWLDEGATPSCALEQLALSVLRAHCPAPTANDDGAPEACTKLAVGVEWWVQHRQWGGTSTDPSIGLHWDTDEEWKSHHGEHIPPWLSTVTYLGSVGAPTIVLPLAADRFGKAVQPPPSASAAGAFVSYPRPGKHLAFDGRLLHGAPYALTTARAPEVRGAGEGADRRATRTTFLANVWLGHKPIGLERLPAQLASRLSVAHAAADLRLSAVLEEQAVEAEEGEGADGPTTQCVAFEEVAVGYPFFHPPIHAQGLPSPESVAAARHSLVHVPRSKLMLRCGGDIPNEA